GRVTSAAGAARRHGRGGPRSLEARSRSCAPRRDARSSAPASPSRRRRRVTAALPAATVGPADDRPPWWVRPGLEIADGRLAVAGRDAEQLALEHGTPLFVYDRARFAENAERLIAALDRAELRHRVRFALKANHAPEVLAVLRGLVGIDACSPGEVLRALE